MHARLRARVGLDARGGGVRDQGRPLQNARENEGDAEGRAE